MRIIRVVATLLLLINLTACTSLGISNNKIEAHRLENSVSNYYYYMEVKDTENIYELLSPWLKKSISRDDYIGDLNKLYSFVDFKRPKNTKIIFIKNKIAITEAELVVIFNDPPAGEDIIVVGCERTLWLKFPDGWYVHKPNLSCDYMLNKEEMNRLIKNLPK